MQRLDSPAQIELSDGDDGQIQTDGVADWVVFVGAVWRDSQGRKGVITLDPVLSCNYWQEAVDGTWEKAQESRFRKQKEGAFLFLDDSKKMFSAGGLGMNLSICVWWCDVLRAEEWSKQLVPSLEAPPGLPVSSPLWRVSTNHRQRNDLERKHRTYQHGSEERTALCLCLCKCVGYAWEFIGVLPVDL